MRLIITRHGETEENAAGIIQGHLQGTLTGKGIDQAAKVAARLKDEKIDRIYSSDLARARDTAMEIAKHHPGVEVELTEAMRERYMGEWQGKTKQEIGLAPGASAAASGLQAKDAEPLTVMHGRASRFIHELLAKHKDETVVLVGHNGINKALAAAVEGKEAEGIKSFDNFHNTSVTIYDIDEDRNHQIHVFNCKAHLDDNEGAKISE